MNFFGIGLPEMAVIAAIGLLVFGPKRLPELGRTLGRTLRGFQSASREFEQEFRSAIHSEAADPSPPVASLDATPASAPEPSPAVAIAASAATSASSSPEVEPALADAAAAEPAAGG